MQTLGSLKLLKFSCSLYMVIRTIVLSTSAEAVHLEGSSSVLFLLCGLLPGECCSCHISTTGLSNTHLSILTSLSVFILCYLENLLCSAQAVLYSYLHA